MLVLSSSSCLSFVCCVFCIILCLCHQPNISTTRTPLFSFLNFPFVPLTVLFRIKAVLPCSFSCFNIFIDVKVFGKVFRWLDYPFVWSICPVLRLHNEADFLEKLSSGLVLEKCSVYAQVSFGPFD